MSLSASIVLNQSYTNEINECRRVFRENEQVGLAALLFSSQTSHQF
jgi:hypothetical protein